MRLRHWLREFRRSLAASSGKQPRHAVRLAMHPCEDRLVPATILTGLYEPVSTIWSTTTNPGTGDSADPTASAVEQARQFLMNHAGELGLNDRMLGDLTHYYSQPLPSGSVERFRQTVDGIPVYDADIAVTRRHDGTVTFVHNAYRSGLNLDSTVPTLTPKAAREVAGNEWKTTGPMQFDETRLIVFPTRTGARLAYEVTMVPSAGTIGEFEVIVDARSGIVLQSVDKANNATGNGNVFAPDPLSSSGQAYGATGYTDGSDADTTQLTAQLSNVTLLDITLSAGTYSLVGPYASIGDFEAPNKGLFTQASSTFNFTRSQDGFEAVNTYYHIDRYMRYLNVTLGLTVDPPQYAGGVQFDPSGLSGADNSHYIGATGRLAFGEGGVDDAEDADVIIHELGHGIHDWVTGQNLSQVNGLSEGTGDYFAQSYSRAYGQWTTSDAAYHWVFNWDGHNSFWAGRTTNYGAVYPGGLTGSIHTDGQIWATANMKIWDILGAAKTDAMMVSGLASTGSSTNQEQAAQALLNAAVGLGFTQAEIHSAYLIYTATGYNVTEPTALPPSNTPPVALPSSVTTNEDTAKTFAVTDFLFSDSQSHPLSSITVQSLTLASGDMLTVNLGAGNVAVTAAMTITAAQIPTMVYTPFANTFGAARSSFQFTVNDAAAGTVAAVMTINVTSVQDTPDAVNDPGATLSEDGADGTINVIANDTDGDGNPTAPFNGGGQFSVDLDTVIAGVQSSVTNAQGVWTLNTTNGIVTFNPADDFNGPASLTYLLTDPTGLSDTASISFTVTAVNDVPVALASSVSTNDNTPYSFAVANFQFSDVELDPLASITIGTLSLAPGDSLTVNLGAGAVPVASGMTITAAQIPTMSFTAPVNTSGTPRSSFMFRVNDADPGTVFATMGITVIDATPPVLLALRPVVTGGSVVNVDLLTASATQLPWQITGFEATYSESVAGAVNATLVGSGFSFAVGAPTIIGSTVRWHLTTLTSGTFTIGSVGSLQDLAGNPSAVSTVNKTFTTYYGDVTGDGAVTNADLNTIRSVYLNGLPYDPFKDLNGDGIVDREDYNIARSRIGS